MPYRKPLSVWYSLLLVIGAALVITGCSDQQALTGPQNAESPQLSVASGSQGDAAQAEADSDLQKELAAVREATSQYQDVKKAEADDYHQHSPFVPGMGFHYVNGSLAADAEVIKDQPEALVYDSNDPDKETRNLGAVEYVIPDPEKNLSRGDLPLPFSGMSGAEWHYESAINAWTLHVWIWLDNPKGVFHPTNPRVNSGA